jgi:hypothetical protein
MITLEEIEKAADFVRDNASKAAQAKADRLHLESFKKAKIAILFGQAGPGKTVAAMEAWAHAHPQYIELLETYKIAIKEDEEIRWLMEAATLKVKVGQTFQATLRAANIY